ncbi:unnamed protein product [Heterobilharzia americana]|nr:unnamed protein product [Heterobilharzia americana]CAH8601451.1 unnamed protein product [Heterobilharzia americana]
MHKTLRAKCILMGSPACGKTSIVQSFCSEGREFSQNYCMSTAVELTVRTVIIPEANDNIELFLYSTPGKEVFNDFTKHYLDLVNVMVVVFDVNDIQSFSAAKLIVSESRKESNHMSIPIALVGNKIDLGLRRVTDKEKAQKFADEQNIPYFETSAYLGRSSEEINLHWLC